MLRPTFQTNLNKTSFCKLQWPAPATTPGQALSEQVPIDMSVFTEQTARELSKQFGIPMQLEDVLRLYNRVPLYAIDLIWKTFFEDDIDYFAWVVKHEKPKTKMYSFERMHAVLETTGGEDKPRSISVSAHGVVLRWGDTTGWPHRDIDLGPAFVEVDPQTSQVRIQHYDNGKRTKGHKDWVTRCKASNPWLKYAVFDK